MKKKIYDKQIEDKIDKLLENEKRFLSIREVTKILKEKYNLKRSPQIIKRHLESLVKKGKIIKKLK
jgi:hypothetical protein